MSKKPRVPEVAEMSAVSDNDVIKEKGARDKMFQKQSDESNSRLKFANVVAKINPLIFRNVC